MSGRGDAGRRTNQTKRELAAEVLREAILSGRYGPGERLRQNQIARELGLSATPVREALRELHAQGLVVHESRRSVRVAEVDLDDLRELYAVRSVLESFAARLSVPGLADGAVARLTALQADMEAALAAGRMRAVQSADKEFHALLYGTAENRHLAALIDQLWESFPRYLLWLVPGRTENSIKEHRRMLQAARRRDGARAARAVEAHLRSALQVALRSHRGARNRMPRAAPAGRSASA